MTIQRLITARVVHRPTVIEIHDPCCTCLECEPYVPSIPRELTIADLSWLTFAGIVVAHVIAFTIDPHGSWAALVDVARSWGL